MFNVKGAGVFLLVDGGDFRLANSVIKADQRMREAPKSQPNSANIALTFTIIIFDLMNIFSNTKARTRANCPYPVFPC
jgi:hypothetical protein